MKPTIACSVETCKRSRFHCSHAAWRRPCRYRLPAEEAWPGEADVGKRLRVGETEGHRYEVVGAVEHSRSGFKLTAAGIVLVPIGAGALTQCFPAFFCGTDGSGDIRDPGCHLEHDFRSGMLRPGQTGGSHRPPPERVIPANALPPPGAPGGPSGSRSLKSLHSFSASTISRIHADSGTALRCNAR